MKKDRLQTYLIIMIAIVTVCLVAVSDQISAINYIYVDVTEEIIVVDESDLSDIQLININTASLDELITIDGIGEALAMRIIEYRETNGDFEYIEQVQLVEGIGEIKFQAIYERCFV
ncbi:MAG: helix-hairpin-helix domain-containing protein [Clostridia bacterium]